MLIEDIWRRIEGCSVWTGCRDRHDKDERHWDFWDEFDDTQRPEMASLYNAFQQVVSGCGIYGSRKHSSGVIYAIYTPTSG